MDSNKIFKSTIKHTFIYSISGILGKAVGFVMLPIYAHYLRGEGYGIIGMVDVVLSVVTLLVGYGIQGAMTRFYNDKKTDEDRKTLISTANIIMLLLVVIVSTPVLFFNVQIANFAFGKSGLGYYIILAILTFMADMSSKSAETYILIKQQSKLYSFLALLRLIIGLSLNIYLIVHLQLGVSGYFYSALTVATLYAITMHGISFYYNGARFNKIDAVEILKYSLPLLPGYIAMFVRTNTARIILRYTLGLAQVGAFEMLFKFATLIGLLIVAPFSRTWDIKRFEIANTAEGPEIIAKMFTLQLSLLMFVGLILSLEIPILLKILAPKEFWLGAYIAFFAVSSRIIIACYSTFYFGLLHVKKTINVSIIQWCSAIVSLVLNSLLIIPFGITGAVISSCLTNATQCLIGYRMAQHHYPVAYEWLRIIKMSCCFVAIFLILEQLSLQNIHGITNWLTISVNPPLQNFLFLLKINTIKNGKIVGYILDNMPVLFDGGIKFLLSFTFLGYVIAVNIIPQSYVIGLFKRNKSFITPH